MPVITNNNEVQDILSISEKLFESNERKNFENNWDELANYLLPMQSGIFNTNVGVPGEKKTTSIFDITGIQANSDLAATFHSTLTNPSTRWSNIEHEDPEVADDDEARAWLEDSRNRMHKAFNRSNFDREVASNYTLFTSLGTMSLQHDALPLKKDGTFGGFYFKAWHLAKIAYMENQFGNVDTIFRKFTFTKKQALDRWGIKGTPKKIMDAKDVTKEFEILHVIRPREGAEDIDELLVPVSKMPF